MITKHIIYIQFCDSVTACQLSVFASFLLIDAKCGWQKLQFVKNSPTFIVLLPSTLGGPQWAEVAMLSQYIYSCSSSNLYSQNFIHYEDHLDIMKTTRVQRASEEASVLKKRLQERVRYKLRSGLGPGLVIKRGPELIIRRGPDFRNYLA